MRRKNVSHEMSQRATILVEIMKLPRCSAERITPYANDERTETGPRCKQGARFIVEGVTLCKRHAQLYALQILLSETKGSGQ